ncbi:MAG: hypothetical protein U1E03_08525 [Hyphomonadaceae bacterium]
MTRKFSKVEAGFGEQVLAHPSLAQPQSLECAKRAAHFLSQAPQVWNQYVVDRPGIHFNRAVMYDHDDCTRRPYPTDFFDYPVEIIVSSVPKLKNDAVHHTRPDACARQRLASKRVVPSHRNIYETEIATGREVCTEVIGGTVRLRFRCVAKLMFWLDTIPTAAAQAAPVLRHEGRPATQMCTAKFITNMNV